MKFKPKTCKTCGSAFTPTSGRQEYCKTHSRTDIEYEPMPVIPDRVKVAPKDQPRVDLALKLARKATAVPELSRYVSGLLAWVELVRLGRPISRTATLALLGHDFGKSARG